MICFRYAKLFAAAAVFTVSSLPSPLMAETQLLVGEHSDCGARDRVSAFRFSDGRLLNHKVGASVTSLRFPEAMAIGPDGFLYVTDFAGDSILRFNVQTGERMEDTPFVAEGVGGLDGPAGLVFKDNLLIVASFENDQILAYDYTTAAPLGPYVNTAGTIVDGPADLVLRGDDALLVISFHNDMVACFNADGSPVNGDAAFILDDSAGPLGSLQAMVAGPDDHLYITDHQFDKVVRFDAMTGQPIGDGIFVDFVPKPTGLGFGPDDELYVASNSQNRIIKFSGSGGFLIGDFIDHDLIRPVSLLFVDTGSCAPDLDNDGEVGFADLVELLSKWGPCP